MAKRPHIIIFNPDEMRWDCLHHMGNPAAITPNLDALAQEEGVSFSRAYCQNPVCVPSRCSFFTGLYPHTTGHRTMANLMKPGEETLFSELRRGGYYVWMNARNDLLAGQYPGWAESHADEIFYGAPRLAPGPEKSDMRGEKGGKWYYSHFEGRLKTDENGLNYSDDDAAVDAAIERLLNPVDDRPMCLFLGLLFPHTPYAVEEPYYSAIDRSKLPPRVRLEDCEGKSKIIRLTRKYANMEQLTEADWDELRAVYLGMCMKVDAQFGRLVKALKDAGIYDDCAIFFFSDHGDWAGDFELPEKAQNAFEDDLSRVPLLVKPPKGVDFEPGVAPALTELVDFYATALDFAGVESSHTHFGRSLRPVLADHGYPLRPYVCCEGGRLPGETHCDEYHDFPNGTPEAYLYYPKMKAQSDDEAHAKGVMLRGERYKLITRISGEDELYDLEEDPRETHNRIDDPALQNIVTEMRLETLRWVMGTSDIVPFQKDQRWTKEMMMHKARRSVPPENLEAFEKAIDSGVPFFQALIRAGGSMR